MAGMQEVTLHEVQVFFENVDELLPDANKKVKMITTERMTML